MAGEQCRAWRERAALDRLWRAGLRLAPEPVAYCPDGPLPQPAVIYRWSEGVLLAGRITSAQDLIDLVGAGAPAHELGEMRWHPNASQLPAAGWDEALSSYAPLPEDIEFPQRLALYNRVQPIWWVGRSALYLLEGAGQVASSLRSLAEKSAASGSPPADSPAG